MSVSTAEMASDTSEASRSSKSEDRRILLLQAAAEVFFEHGFAATSVDAIIEKIGGSKRTIYNEFGSKEGLFKCLVTESTMEAAAVLDKPLPKGDLEENLLEIARRLMTSQMSTRVLGVYRAMMTESGRFPDLAKIFYQSGASTAADMVADILKQARKRGIVELEDCRVAADIFIGMLRSNIHLEVVLQLRPPLTEKEIARWSATVVRIFLSGITLDKA